MAPLGGNLFCLKNEGSGDYLTLFGPLGQTSKLTLSDNQAWELLQVLVDDIERLAATQHTATLDDEQQHIIALHQVYKALEYSDQTVEDLAWTGDHEATRAIVSQGSAAAEKVRREVESWQEPILNLIIAIDDAALLLADASEAEEKTNQGATLWDEGDNQNIPAS